MTPILEKSSPFLCGMRLSFVYYFPLISDILYPTLSEYLNDQTSQFGVQISVPH